MSTNDNTSTLKSYVDSASGYVQNVVGSVLGSSGDQVNETPCKLCTAASMTSG